MSAVPPLLRYIWNCAAVSGWLSLLVMPNALAQIIPDQTLGNERSIVRSNAVIHGFPAEQIEGGAQRGANLFHSFTDFNVNQGQRVYFANPVGVDNILSRVTGRSVSRIDGVLGVDGPANLFLLNPNGIVLGANATLDLRGSFTATTADRIFFADGSWFSATQPQGASLLSVSVPLGVQRGVAAQGDLTNQANLTVDPGQSLTLFGRTIANSGNLTAPGGSIQVLGDRIQLLNAATLDVSSATGGGSVQIGGDYQGGGTLPTATETVVGPDVTIHADAIATGHGGRAIVWADGTTRFAGSITARGGAQGGDGGFVETSGRNQLTVAPTARVNTTAPNGIAGNWLLDPTSITVVPNGGSATTVADANTNSGDSTIDFGVINTALGGGNVTLAASNFITVAPSTSLTIPGTSTLTLNAPTINLNAPIVAPLRTSLQGNASVANVGAGGTVQNGVDVVAANGTVNLAATTYFLTNTVRITRSVTVNGAGATNTRVDGNNAVGVFNVSNSGTVTSTVTIADLTIANGQAKGGDGTNGGGGGLGAGGGLFIDSGTVTVNRVAFTNNQAIGGDGGFGVASSGGSGGNSSFGGGGGGGGNGGVGGNGGGGGGNGGVGGSNGEGSDGGNGGGGGGGFGDFGSSGVGYGGGNGSNGGGGGGFGGGKGGGGGFGGGGGGGFGGGGGGSSFSGGNGGGGGGGGFGGGGGGGFGRSSGGSFGGGGSGGGGSGVRGGGGGGAGLGGAIFIRTGSLTLNDSTLTGNSAAGGTGGEDGQGAGGAIFVYTGASATLTNVTLDGNTAGNKGGGLYNFGDTLNVTNTIVAGNSAPTGREISSDTTITSGGNNLFGFSGNDGLQGVTRIPSDIVPTIPLSQILTPLVSNPTPSNPNRIYALLPGSPAIDAGGPGATTKDQRGVTAVRTRDIGAFESQGFTITASGTPQTTNVTRPFATPLQVTVASNFGEPVAGGTVTLTPPTTGASANLSANTVVLDASGQASVTASANTTPGNYGVTASASGATPASFNLTNILFSNLTVDTLLDELNNNLDPGNISLREAISYIDTSGTITFAPALANGTITTTGGEFAINRSMTIDGTGATNLAISGSNTNRVFNIATGATVNLSNLTIRNGNATGSDGGGILNGGTLTLTNGTLDANTAGNVGGGIAQTSTGTLTIANSRFTNNRANSSNLAIGGGAIFANNGTTTIDNSTLSGNSAVGIGGAINASSGNATITIRNSTLNGNSADNGGAIGSSGNLIIENSTISGNSARESGGILNFANSLTLTNSTVTGNTASQRAGGISNGGGGTLTIRNSILSGNAAPVGREISSANTITSGGNNLFGFGGDAGLQGVTAIASDIVPTVPLSQILAPLGNYGGATQTYALLPGSPAIDAGGTGATSTDQRGVAAVGTRDIGAFESRGFTITASEGTTPQTTNVTRPFAIPLQITVASNFGEPVAGGTVTLTPPTTGASANLSGSTVVLDASGQAIVNASANATPGNYSVTASASGAATPASFNLTNALFSNLTVDTLLDELDNNLDPGNISLREAISYIDTSGTITFAPTLANGTITTTPALGEFAITRSMTIDGTGATNLAISGGNTNRVFDIAVGTTVNLSNLTIRDGNANGLNGGGIRNSGTLTLTNSTLSGNTADVGGGIANSGGGTLTLTNSTLSGNTADSGGGGIVNSGTLTLTNSTLSGNTARFGGGIDSDGFGTLTLTNSTLSGNTATTSGGGITNGGTLTLTNSTLSGNSADNGGGIDNNGTLTLINSTLSGNTATNSGGGITNDGTLTVTNSTLSGNTATNSGGGITNDNSGTLTVTNTIVAGNNAPNGWEISSLNTITSGGNNLFGFNGDAGLQGVTTIASDIVPTVPLSQILAPLGNYGGPTQTHALLPGSPAIDAGGTGATPTDQRGIGVVGGTRDIGAFESQGFTITASGGTPQTTNVTSPFATPLQVTVASNSPGEPVAGGTVALTPPTTGASANLSANTVVLDAVGQASVIASANATPGNYSVTASASGATPASFNLTNILFSNLIVDTANDIDNGNLADGDRSLREVLGLIDPGGTVSFAQSLQNQPIVLTQGSLTLDRSVSIQGLGVDSLTINGNGNRIFNVTGDNTNASIQQLTLTGGELYQAGGTLNLSNVRLDSITTEPAATTNVSDRIDATGNQTYNGTVTLLGNTTLTGNAIALNRINASNQNLTLQGRSNVRLSGLVNSQNLTLQGRDITISGDVTTGQDLTIRGQGDVQLNSNLTVGRDLLVASGGTINQPAANSIVLTTPGSTASFTTSLANAGDVTIQGTGDIRFRNDSQVGGNLTVNTSSGRITGIAIVAGTTTLNDDNTRRLPTPTSEPSVDPLPGGGFSIVGVGTVNLSNIPELSSTVNGEVRVSAIGGTDFGGNNFAGTPAISLNSNANSFPGLVSVRTNLPPSQGGTVNITQSGGPLNISGPLTINATSDGTLNLTNPNNRFGPLQLTAGTANITQSNDVILGQSTIQNSLSVRSNGNITDQAPVTVTNGNGNATFTTTGTGNITLTQLNLRPGGLVSLNTRGGDATLTAGSVNLDDSTVRGNLTLTSTSGGISDRGNLTVTGLTTLNANNNDITLNNGNDLNTVTINSGRNVTLRDVNLLRLSNAQVTGNLNLTATRLNIQESGVQVTGGGDFSITANNLEVGAPITGSGGSWIVSTLNPRQGISLGNSPTPNNLTLTPQELSDVTGFRRFEIGSETGSGPLVGRGAIGFNVPITLLSPLGSVQLTNLPGTDLGQIRMIRAGEITLTSTLPGNDIVLNNTRLEAAGTDQASGNLTLQSARDVSLTNTELISTPTRSGGSTINVSGRKITLNQSQILSQRDNEALSGGNINLTATGSLQLQGTSLIETQPGSRVNGIAVGGGGTVTINSSIINAARPQPGDRPNQGGNDIVGAVVTTDNKVNLGLIQRRDQLTSANDIVATSSFNQILPSVDPTRGLTELPIALSDPANQIDPGCRSVNAAAGQFVITGRGGLPPAPSDPIAADAVNVPWVTEPANPTPTTGATPPVTRTTVPNLEEAQGWVRDAAGGVIFVAEPGGAIASAPPGLPVSRQCSPRMTRN